MRHSESQFLSAVAGWKAENPKESLPHDEWYLRHDLFALEPEYVDPELSAHGIQICEAFNQQSLEGIHNTVFVSPFMRTIHTACHVLKSFKGKEKLRLVLEPLAREQTLVHNTMLSRAQFLRARCAEWAQEFGLIIDCSFLDDEGVNQEHWQIPMLENKARAKELLDVLGDSSGSQKFDIAAFSRLREFLLTSRVLNEEDCEVLARVERLRYKIRSVVEKETGGQPAKVLLFTHYMVINGLKETKGIDH